MIKPNQFLGLVVFALWAAGCTGPYTLEQNGTDGTTGTGDSTYGIDDTYGSYGTTAYPVENYGSGYSSAGSYAGGSNPGTADYYNHPQYGVNVTGGPDATAKDRIIYFSYDSANIDERSASVIREHAKYLRKHPQMMVVLEGHTDERGTREYNIGLGERRAYSVKNIFLNAGVGAQQMRVLSYGEERPASFGSTEQDYAKNRRVVIIY